MDLVVQEIQIENFRNYTRYHLEPHHELTVIHGPNAAGKTNLLEALQLMTAGESFRRPRIEELIRLGESRASVRLTATGERSSLEVSLELDSQKKRSYKVNGKASRTISGSSTRLPCVLFSPGDLNLITGPADRRRVAIDQLGEQLSASYKALRRDYARILRQRNRLLKEGSSAAELGVWTDQLAEVGSRVTKHRVRLIERLRGHLASIQTAISGGEVVRLNYLPTWTTEETLINSSPEELSASLGETLDTVVSLERMRGTTLHGPHRDDIEVLLDERAARVYSSQGQQRSLALAWKLAEVEVVEEVLGTQPLLLLDDVMSELDETRRALLTQRVRNAAQTVITTTNLAYFDPALLSQGRVVSLG